MTAQPGWYDAGVPGRERWWDGAQWTAHERVIAQAPPAAGTGWHHQPVATQNLSTAASAPMGWYQVPGETDVRWWDGAAWAPYRLRDGVPKPDAFAVEPPQAALVGGILFVFAGLMQFGTAALGDSGSLGVTGVLSLLVGALWLVSAALSNGVRKKPAPRSGAMQPDVVRPLPGEAEGVGAGWYPVAGQVTRWWTGTRWSWYIGQKHGVRPAHAGPRGYLVSMLIGWIMAGIGVVALIGGAVATAVLQSQGPVVALGIGAAMFGVILALLGGLLLLLTYQRRYMMILPEKAPPLR